MQDPVAEPVREAGIRYAIEEYFDAQDCTRRDVDHGGVVVAAGVEAEIDRALAWIHGDRIGAFEVFLGGRDDRGARVDRSENVEGTGVARERRVARRPDAIRAACVVLDKHADSIARCRIESDVAVDGDEHGFGDDGRRVVVDDGGAVVISVDDDASGQGADAEAKSEDARPHAERAEVCLVQVGKHGRTPGLFGAWGRLSYRTPKSLVQEEEPKRSVIVD